MELTVMLPDRDVYVNGHKLDPKPSQKRHNHSPDGFMWGYEGSGPAQLALAVMMKMLEGSPDADRINEYQRFKSDVIAQIPMDKSMAVEMDFVGWLNGKKPVRLVMTEIDTPKVKEVDARRGQCSPGCDGRCASAESSNCDCACGGANHGSARRVTL